MHHGRVIGLPVSCLVRMLQLSSVSYFCCGRVIGLPVFQLSSVNACSPPWALRVCHRTSRVWRRRPTITAATTTTIDRQTDRQTERQSQHQQQQQEQQQQERQQRACHRISRVSAVFSQRSHLQQLSSVCLDCCYSGRVIGLTVFQLSSVVAVIFSCV